MGTPINPDEVVRKFVYLGDSELQEYRDALSRSGTPRLVSINDHTEANETLKILHRMRAEYNFDAVLDVEITPEGIFRYKIPEKT